MINGVWKNRVRFMSAKGDNEGAKRELLKAKMSSYDNAKTKDKIFIDINLAYHSYNEKNSELANIYLSYIEKIFEEDERNIEDMTLEYCDYLWLDVNNNYNDMTTEKLIKKMIFIYDYYKRIDEDEEAIKAIKTIFDFKGESDDTLDRLMKYEYIYDYSYRKKFLRDCDRLNHSLYIRILNKYKLNMDAG